MVCKVCRSLLTEDGTAVLVVQDTRTVEQQQQQHKAQETVNQNGSVAAADGFQPITTM